MRWPLAAARGKQQLAAFAAAAPASATSACSRAAADRNHALLPALAGDGQERRIARHGGERQRNQLGRAQARTIEQFEQRQQPHRLGPVARRFLLGPRRTAPRPRRGPAGAAADGGCAGAAALARDRPAAGLRRSGSRKTGAAPSICAPDWTGARSAQAAPAGQRGAVRHDQIADQLPLRLPGRGDRPPACSAPRRVRRRAWQGRRRSARGNRLSPAPRLRPRSSALRPRAPPGSAPRRCDRGGRGVILSQPSPCMPEPGQQHHQRRGCSRRAA